MRRNSNHVNEFDFCESGSPLMSHHNLSFSSLIERLRNIPRLINSIKLSFFEVFDKENGLHLEKFRNDLFSLRVSSNYQATLPNYLCNSSIMKINVSAKSFTLLLCPKHSSLQNNLIMLGSFFFRTFKYFAQ